MSIAASGPGVILDSVKIEEFPQTEFFGDNRDFINHVRHMQPGEMSLDAQHFWGLQGSPGLTARFTESTDDAKGREASFHEVRFGQLLLESNRDQELPTPIAVKPQSPLEAKPKSGWPAISAAEVLAHEWSANEYVAGLSNYEQTYVPLGVWKTKNRTPKLLTLFDESTQSFDNIFWAKGDDTKRISSPRIVKALHLSMYALGVLHGAGLIHQDPNVKNLARDSRQVRFIDLECLGMLDKDEDGLIADNEETAKLLRKDMSIFTGSTLFIGEPPVPTELHDKVEKIVGKDRVIDAITKQYWQGIVQGQLRNGTVLPEKLVMQPEQLSAIFEFIKNNFAQLTA